MRSNTCDEEERHSGGSSSSRSRGTNNLRVLLQRPCLTPPLTLNGDVGDNKVRNYSYRRLPQLQLLKLSILKLDGSAFEVLVGKNASVSELKQVIEEVFSSSSEEEGRGISWSLVWGHFCLCYEGQKLTNDKAYIRNYGIKEGDQLQFIRHMCINFSPLEKRSEKESIGIWKKESMFPSRTNAFKNIDEDEEENPVPARFKMVQLFRGWLSYSRWV